MDIAELREKLSEIKQREYVVSFLGSRKGS